MTIRRFWKLVAICIVAFGQTVATSGCDSEKCATKDGERICCTSNQALTKDANGNWRCGPIK